MVGHVYYASVSRSCYDHVVLFLYRALRVGHVVLCIAVYGLRLLWSYAVL